MPEAEKYLIAAIRAQIAKNFPEAIKAYENLAKASPDNAKKGGKITISGRIVISLDGKSRTVTTSGTDSKGNKVSSMAVNDKQ